MNKIDWIKEQKDFFKKQSEFDWTEDYSESEKVTQSLIDGISPFLEKIYDVCIENDFKLPRIHCIPNEIGFSWIGTFDLDLIYFEEDEENEKGFAWAGGNRGTKKIDLSGQSQNIDEVINVVINRLNKNK